MTARWAAAEIPAVNRPVLKLPVGIKGVEVQQALDSLPETGGEVVLPAGTIEIYEPIVLCRDHQTLRGMGPGTVLRLADNANCPVLILGEPVNSPGRTVRRLVVSELSIDGNRLRQTRELWREVGEGSELRNNGITVQAVENSIIEDVTIARCRSGGLVTTRKVRQLIVRGLDSSENQFDGLACYETENCVFVNLRLHDNPGAGISLDLGFKHNTIRNAWLANNDLGIFMRASRDNRFGDVVICRSHHYGVFMADAGQPGALQRQAMVSPECARNLFNNLAVRDCGDAAFRVNDVTCTNNIILQPQFADNLPGGLSSPDRDLVTVRRRQPESLADIASSFSLPYIDRTVRFAIYNAQSLCSPLQPGAVRF